MDSLYGARASMEPAGLIVRYVDVESGIVCSEEYDVFGPFDAEELAVKAAFDGEVLELSADVRADVRLEDVQVVLRHAFGHNEEVLLNGYQSWTDTVERPAWSRLRGLRGVPKPLVSSFALDGSGDYAITDYSRRYGDQHGFSYATFRRGDGLVLVGSLDERRGFTVIRSQAADGLVVLQPECPARTLQAGEHVVLGRFAITRGTADEAYDRWFELAGIVARPVRPLVGYTSWYRHYGEIDEAKLRNDLAGMVGEMDARGLRDHAVVSPLFQIDDGYCKVGDWLRLNEEKFPHGLKPLADEISAAGFVPGLWVAPFVCEKDSRIFTECNDWLLRDGKGNLVRTGPHWSDGYALDTRNVEVRSYILNVLGTMTNEWGFRLLKADFLYAACMYPHDGLNCGELMADAMSLLRTGAGDDALILGCGVPLASAFGVVDYCRIGCDVGLDWNDKVYMRPLHRERVSTRNSLANTYGRAPLDGRAFGNDPDVFFLRADVKLTPGQRDELLFADADLGSVFLTSDDMGAWTPAMRQRYEEALRVFIGRHAAIAEGAER